jgi:hypothetical protein
MNAIHVFKYAIFDWRDGDLLVTEADLKDCNKDFGEFVEAVTIKVTNGIKFEITGLLWLFATTEWGGRALKDGDLVLDHKERLNVTKYGNLTIFEK